MNEAVLDLLEQFPSGIDYSEPPLDKDRTAHSFARYAVVEAANALKTQWATFLTIKPEDFPLPPPKKKIHPFPEISRASDVERIFNGLARKWQEETAGSSVTTRRYAHTSYHAILLLKEDAIPLILRELKERPDWWFEALELLTKANPVKPGSTFEEAVNAWLEWGKRDVPV